MINIFGTTIETPSIQVGEVFENILVDVSKRDSERKTLREFLGDKSLNGQTRIGEIASQAKSEANLVDNPLEYKEQAFNYYLSILKQTGAYEKMVLEIISKDESFTTSKITREILLGKSHELPPTFPGDHKKAEALVYGTASSSIGENECKEFLVSKFVKSNVQEIAKDLFFASNHNLSSEQSMRFTGVMYEIKKLKTAEFTNLPQIKQNILMSIKTGQILEMIHMKCLRFTFPYGNRLSLLEHTDDVIVTTKNNETHQPKTESKLFERLENILSIFEKFGLNVKFTVLVSDQEINDYFPNKNTFGMLPTIDLVNADQSLHKYLDAIKKCFTKHQVFFLREYLSNNNLLSVYDHTRSKTICDLSVGKSIYPENFVESRVDYRYESNLKIFTNPSDRETARIQINGVLASMMALCVLGSKYILIEDDRGDENNYIGGHGKSALPVIFCKLRDKAN